MIFAGLELQMFTHSLAYHTTSQLRKNANLSAGRTVRAGVSTGTTPTMKGTAGLYLALINKLLLP